MTPLTLGRYHQERRLVGSARDAVARAMPEEFGTYVIPAAQTRDRFLRGGNLRTGAGWQDAASDDVGQCPPETDTRRRWHSSPVHPRRAAGRLHGKANVRAGEPSGVDVLGDVLCKTHLQETGIRPNEHSQKAS